MKLLKTPSTVLYKAWKSPHFTVLTQESTPLGKGKTSQVFSLTRANLIYSKATFLVIDL